ncbi:MAG: preprotein translocase subunit YajC [Magnetococcales bacterium]|nr:preprotein translocase subunit YajC [Magnetococcales bacterium]MBF0439757.1 preprotein translocase subunit YajC [Magnetococcales bacterium]
MFEWITPAYAQSASPGPEAAIGNILFMVLLFAIFYFLLIRPQQKQAKQHKEMVANLQRGDSVETRGGLMGRIHRVEDEYVMVELGEVEMAPRQFKPVRVKVRREAVATVTAKAGAKIGGDLALDESSDKSKS